jgi:hypothetical protein
MPETTNPQIDSLGIPFEVDGEIVYLSLPKQSGTLVNFGDLLGQKPIVLKEKYGMGTK